MSIKTQKPNWFDYDSDSKRTIELVLDVEKNQIIVADDFFDQSEQTIIKARSVLELSYRSNMPKYQCAICEQGVKIVGRRIFERHKTIYFFSHLTNSNDCPIKTDNNLSLYEILAKKYRGINEGVLHKKLKSFIAQSLSNTNSILRGFKNVAIEKTFFGGKITERQWRRPDIRADFNGKQMVFELQLSTTFLSVVVDRDVFYCLNNTYILWVFGSFNMDEQRLMEKDLYYAHKRNVFVLDENAQRMSIERKELILCCYWQLPKIINNKVEIGWHHKMVGLDDLIYDEANFEVYYHDSDKDFYEFSDSNQRKILDEWEMAKKERWSIIFNNLEKKRLLHVKYDGIYGLIGSFARVKQKGKWGFVDEKMNVIIPIVYDEVKNFHKGLAVVRLSEKWGIINEGNEKIIPIEYDKIEEFIDEKTKAFKDNSCYYIDVYGKITEPELIPFYEKGRWGFRSKEGEVLIKPEYTEVKPFIDGKAWVRYANWGQINVFGKKIIPFQYGELIEFVDNKAKVLRKDNQNWGYIDLDGETIIPFEYSSINDFIDGKAKAIKRIVIPSRRYRGRNTYEYYEGYIDIEGNEIIPFIYDEIGEFVNGIAKTKEGRYWGYIDEFGIAKIPFSYDEISDFVDGIAKAKIGYLWGCIDEFGNEKVQFIYNEILDFIDGIAISKKGYLWGCINKSGNEIIDFKYNDIQLNDDGIFIASKGTIYTNGNWIKNFVRIDKNGNLLIENKIEIKENIFKGTKLNMWGIENSEGEIIIPFEYDNISDFIDGVAIARKGSLQVRYDEKGKVLINAVRQIGANKTIGTKHNKWGVEDENGNEEIPFEYDEIGELVNGKAKICRNKLWGYIGFIGNHTKVIIPCEYDWIAEFNENRAKAHKNGLFGYLNYIDDHVEEIIPFEYQAIEKFVNGIARAKKDGYWGYIDEQNQTIIGFDNDFIVGNYNGGILALKNSKFIKIPFNVNAEKLNLDVSSVTHFGVFLNVFGNIDGLLHFSEIERVNPSIHFNRYSHIDVFIGAVDLNKNRLSFVLELPKAVEKPNRIDVENQSFKLRQSIVGLVVGIKDYGLFVKIGDNKTALLHISQLKLKHQNTMKYFIGESINVEIISIDADTHKINLGLS